MADKMTHWERVRAALSGAPVDRPPVSAWRHFFAHETSAEGLAEAMLEFQRRFDWDFMKVNPRATYHVEDWGVALRFSDSDSVGHETVDWPVKQPSDWEKIQPLDVNEKVLGQQLEALKLIADGLGGQVPFLMTVFTPLSITAQLAGSEGAMSEYLKTSPTEVHRALDAITDTFGRFAEACLDTGAAGLFFATTKWGTYDRLTDDQYAEFGRPYDSKILGKLARTEFDILHVCQSNNMLKALADYPVAAFNWDTQDKTNASLDEGARLTGKAVIGGVSFTTVLLEGTPDDVASEVGRTKESMEGSRWMFGTGCTFPPAVPEANLRALRDAAGQA